MRNSHSINYGKCVFSDFEIRSNLKGKRKLAKFIPYLVYQYTKKECYLQYTFVSDDFLLELNQTHLHHNTYTDIITFDLSSLNASSILGDIYISIDRVHENANLHQTSFLNEAIRVVLHGALHLSGFGDKSSAEQKKMRKLEDEWMLKFKQFIESDKQEL
jgi:probable rRNA maturation factor